MACVRTDLCVVAGSGLLLLLLLLEALPGLQQSGFFQDVDDLPQGLVPQRLHDRGEHDLMGRTNQNPGGVFVDV